MNKKSMRTPSLDDVFKMDQLLHQLASYEVSGGRIIVPKSMEEALELQRKTADKFNYFKTLLQSGECSFDFIKSCVLKKNGPFPQEEKIDINSPDFVDKITTWKQSENIEPQFKEDFIKSLMRLFKSEIPEDEKTIEVPILETNLLPPKKVKRSKKSTKKK